MIFKAMVLVFQLLSLSAVAAPTAEESPLPRPKKKTEKRRVRRTPHEKETEGTEALDRFEAETVLKSKYQVEGQSLEVDPD